MTDLEARIAKLEAIGAIRRQVAYRCLLDDAPYDADGLTAMWTEDGHLEGCDAQFSGRVEIHAFYCDLVASFTMHYATNGVIDVEPSCERARAHWYGWETPVISGIALLGAFSSDQEYEKVEGEWLSSRAREAEHFLCAVKSGWVKDVEPHKERASQGAERASQGA